MQLSHIIGILVFSLVGVSVRAVDLPKYELHIRHSEVADGQYVSYADILDRADDEIWLCQFAFTTAHPSQYKYRCTAKPLPHLQHFQIDDINDAASSSAPWNAFRWLVDQESGDIVVCRANFKSCLQLERPKVG